MNCNEIINKLRTTRNAEKDELVYLLDNITDDGGRSGALRQ